jgi:hypothetical protein
MRLLLFFVSISCFTFGQKEIKLSSMIDKVTIFFQGAQVQHQKKTELSPGRQILVFEKLTDYIDPNSVQLKATGDLTILSVSTRKNYEDLKMSITEIEELNKRKNMLYDKDQLLRDEFSILQNDKNLLQINSDLKGSEVGMKVSELKEAYAFIHLKMLEIVGRQTVLIKELETLQKEINKVEQEIQTRQSKPVINFTEILVEVDVASATNSTFDFNYISPRASWTPYYDLRSDGIGKPVRLEAKALVNQSTGIEWKNVDLVLSTNDPYENSKEPILQEWYLNYNNYPQPKNVVGRNIPTFDYSGQKLRGEVIDASTGEPLAFAKVTFSNNPSVGAVTDFDGKFEVIVPKGERYLTASYIGFNAVQLAINAPYLKFFVQPQEVSLEEVVITSNKESSVRIQQDMRKNVSQIEGVQLSKRKKLNFLGSRERSESDAWEYRGDMAGEAEKLEEAKNVQTVISKKELRVEYAIQTKMTIPSDGQDQRVQISTYELPANYEYHAAPKLDPSVYLVAQVSGWEKLNLLNGESNLYFDGTYIGKTYIDVNSTKDTLSFSLGKDNKIQMERTKVKENSKTKTIGTRQKVDVSWEIKLKNNGGANIPIFIKDQFPISIVEDIKVKRGEFSEGKIADKSGIITWNFMLDASQNKILKFDYSVDYQKGYVLYLE